MLKIAHLGDTHIRNFDRQDQYRACFEDLYEKLKKENVDYIIHCGDIAHSKTNISPEFVELCTDFLKNLEAIAPTYVILGNHDGNLRNLARQDAITPLVEALSLDNLFLLKDSGECQVDDLLTLNVLSVFDEENWVKPSDPNKINIALYHGGVRGSETDMGWNVKVDHNVHIFDGFDFALLGDIHKSNQIVDNDGRVRYCGSTIQQNHGETPDKGFLIWEIEDADNYEVRHIILEDPSPHVTINLTKKGNIPKNTNIPDNAIVRAVSPVNISAIKRRRVAEQIRSRFNPLKTTVVSKEGSSNDSIAKLVGSSELGNLRDIKVQEKLIVEFLKEEFNLDQDAIEEVLLLNKKYDSLFEPDVFRGVNWSVESLGWDNLFNYGKGNYVDFSSLNGIVGIFGKNYSGKSSIIDTLMYTLTGATSKSKVKNGNIINQTQDCATSKLVITSDNKKYHIDKRLNRKPKDPNSAEHSLEFWYEDSDTGNTYNLNGETTSKTQANIRKHLGSKEDFMMTSFCSQTDSLKFISHKSKDRKLILNKFLDLNIFEAKAALASEDSKNINGAYKLVEKKDYDSEIKEGEEQLSAAAASLEEQSKRCDILKEKHKQVREKISKIDIDIASYPKLDIDIGKIEKDIASSEASMADVLKDLSRDDELIAKHQDWITKADNYISETPLENLTRARDDLKQKSSTLAGLLSDAERLESEKGSLEKRISLLTEVPCGDKFPSCKFLQDAVMSKSKIGDVSKELVGIRKKTVDIENTYEDSDLTAAEERVEKYRKFLEVRSKYRSELSEMQLIKERNISQKKDLERTLESLRENERLYHENEKDCRIVAKLSVEKEGLQASLEDIICDMEECESKVHALLQQKGVCEQRIENLEQKRAERDELRKKNMAYENFKLCMHYDGISSQIIKRFLPVINEEISKVLVEVVAFEVFLDLEGKELEIYIRHPNYDARLIELASGAEKTIASMAIRLALSKIGTLPKSNIFILDEPATDLDQENMEGFVRILEMLKSQFKTVILISHLDALKECVDSEITIDKKDGFAHVDC